MHARAASYRFILAHGYILRERKIFTNNINCANRMKLPCVVIYLARVLLTRNLNLSYRAVQWHCAKLGTMSIS